MRRLLEEKLLKIRTTGSYSVTPGDRSRTHKGAIGIDRDPSII
jgi:hypothetical protein